MSKAVRNLRFALAALFVLICLPVHAYKVTFDTLSEGHCCYGYSEGPIQFQFQFSHAYGTNVFGNSLPSLSHRENNGGFNGSATWVGQQPFYLSSFEVGPSQFTQNGPGFSVSAYFQGLHQWTLSGRQQRYERLDLSRIFTSDSKALSTIKIDSIGFSLQSNASICCTGIYLDNIDFSPSAVTTQHGDVTMPTGSSGGSFNFDVPINRPNEVIFIDPIVAVGYEYKTAAGNPNFAGVLLPNIGDGIYSLEYEVGGTMVTKSITHDQLFRFGDQGVSKFRVLGIEVDAALDPNDPAAFVTGLMFVTAGSFTGQMTPITAAVPEPGRLALTCLGVCAILTIGRARTKNRSRLHAAA